jgi:serine/threonine protein kinase
MTDEQTRRLGSRGVSDTAVTSPWLNRALDAPQPLSPDAPLERLGYAERYERVATLGEGGMGVVALCTDQQIGRRVAMKTMRAEIVSEQTHARFLREARVQGQLEHPAIVPVYDLGIDPDGSMYFTMKRVRGVTLEEILRGPQGEDYSRRRILTAFSSVCLAVDFAHQHGVIHRDLKPENIMLGDYGEVYVLDWGLARVEGADELQVTVRLKAHPAVDEVTLRRGKSPAQTALGAILGTPGYMAPEQVTGEPPSSASDVYALGSLLFEILTGERLHPAEDWPKVLADTVAGVEARPSVRAPDADVPPELEALLVRATARDAEARCQSAREIHHALEAYLDGERDEELRRQMSLVYTDRAVAAAEAAKTSASDLDRRREAMREIGRALALDPDSPRAMEALIGLLRQPPRETPEEVELELASNERHRARWVARVGAVIYATLLLYLPLFFWTGLRRWEPVALFYGMALAAGATSWLASRSREQPITLTLLALILSNVAFACTAPIFGPLLATPTLVAVNTVAYVAYLPPRFRWAAPAMGCTAILGALAAMRLGVTPSYSFTEAGMFVPEGAIHFTPVPTITFLTVIALAGVLMGSFALTRIRDSLDATERQLFLYVWHLRELVPEAARGPTDPTAARRLRRRTHSAM